MTIALEFLVVAVNPFYQISGSIKVEKLMFPLNISFSICFFGLVVVGVWFSAWVFSGTRI